MRDLDYIEAEKIAGDGSVRRSIKRNLELL